MAVFVITISIKKVSKLKFRDRYDKAIVDWKDGGLYGIRDFKT